MDAKKKTQLLDRYNTSTAGCFLSWARRSTTLLRCAGSWGSTCAYTCYGPLACKTPSCGQHDAALVSCESCVTGYWGTTCGSTCFGTSACNSPTCNQSNSLVLSCGSCAAGYWGLREKQRALVLQLVILRSTISTFAIHPHALSLMPSPSLVGVVLSGIGELHAHIRAQVLRRATLGYAIRAMERLLPAQVVLLGIEARRTVCVLKLLCLHQPDMRPERWNCCFVWKWCCWVLGYDVRIFVLKCIDLHFADLQSFPALAVQLDTLE